MEQTSSNRERRINERLLSYWEELKAERPFPAEAEIDPDELADIWDSCFLVQVGARAAQGGYKYTYLGPSLIEAYGDDLTNHEVSSHLIALSNPHLVQHFDEVARTAKPLVVESEFTNLKNMIVKYRSCMLPLGTLPGQVDYIIGGMKWKAF